MNIVGIEVAVSRIAEAPFDAAEFPNQMVAAFGAPVATITEIRTATQRQSEANRAVV